MKLTIMGKNNCPYCDLAKRHLEDKGIAFEYVKIDEDMAAYETFMELGVKSVPQICQNGKIVIKGGWDGLKSTPISELQQMVGGE